MTDTKTDALPDAPGYSRPPKVSKDTGDCPKAELPDVANSAKAPKEAQSREDLNAEIQANRVAAIDHIIDWPPVDEMTRENYPAWLSDDSLGDTQLHYAHTLAVLRILAEIEAKGVGAIDGIKRQHQKNLAEARDGIIGSVIDMYENPAAGMEDQEGMIDYQITRMCTGPLGCYFQHSTGTVYARARAAKWLAESLGSEGAVS